ncbi:hypothetical protein K4K61_002599 [Colletotrichum sp. SAR11_59]|nr:hypothetical protein K4K61_002599 [Colletotrichum sp. SAR11_59]
MRIDRDMDERDLKGPTPQGLHVSKTKRWYLRCVASVDDNVGRLLDYLDAEGLTEATPVTFLDYAELPIPEAFQGRSFRPILEGCTPPDWRSAMYYPGTLDELQDPEWKLFDLHNDPYELDNLADEPEKAELLAGLKAELERAQVEVGDTPYVRVSAFSAVEGDAPFLFTENETNNERLFGVPNETPFVKDGVHEAVVGGHANQVNPTQGSKVAAHVQALVAPGASLAVRVRFADYALEHPSADFDEVFAARVAEADAFYDAIHPAHLTVDERRVQRQAFYMIGLVIVDDQPVVRDGLRGMFTGDPRFKVLDVA